jgi:hypothetical protein
LIAGVKEIIDLALKFPEPSALDLTALSNEELVERVRRLADQAATLASSRPAEPTTEDLATRSREALADARAGREEDE